MYGAAGSRAGPVGESRQFVATGVGGGGGRQPRWASAPHAQRSGTAGRLPARRRPMPQPAGGGAVGARASRPHVSAHCVVCTSVAVTARHPGMADEARFEDCEGREVLFIEPFLNPETTRLNMTGIDSSHFVGVRVPDGATVYNPSFVADRLRECGAPVSGRGMVAREPGVPPGYVQVLERLMAAYRRANPVCADDDRLGKIFSAPEWGTLENLLIKHKLIVKETGHPGGAPITLFRRRFIAEQLMSGLNGDLSGDRRVDGFWRALAAEARENSGIGG